MSRGGAEEFTPYHRRLLLLVSLATLFEGFDTLLISLALPYLGREFGVDSDATGAAVGTISLGTVLAFVPVRLADRYGRRPLLLRRSQATRWPTSRRPPLGASRASWCSSSSRGCSW